MSVLLQLKGIRKTYGHAVLLEDASASFAHDQKIGVIGRNGAGKSTLCRIITGHETMDSGSVIKNSELKLSYLEQHDPYKTDETVLDFLVRYTGKEEWECGEMAGKFQLPYEKQHAAIGTLPGGYRTRVKLAAMLLRDPNFLILDEPTNYLDLSTLIILENFLQDFNGGYLIVSHDREFLKRTCDHTLEIENGRLSLYPGNIEDYFEFKEENRAQQIAYNRTVEKKREQLQEFVDRFKAKASTATRAKSKMKQISKLKTIEIAHTLAAAKIRIPSVENKAGIALQCSGLSVGYPDRTVARGIEMEFERGDRIAILGDNGQGKTTFLRTLASDLQPLAGSFRWGTGLRVAYYAQHVFTSLHPQDDVFTHLQREASQGVTTQDVLNLAGSFLFRGDEVKKRISVLSGGERARCVLAGLLLSRSHVLMLDEPTNHLDFETVEALADALREFNGTVFFISHDRTFVNLIATKIVDVKDGRITAYPGTYEDYVYSLEARAREEMGGAAEEDGGAPAQAAKPEREGGAGEKAGSYEDFKQLKSDMTKLTQKIKKAETRVQNLTQERDRLLKDMKENPFNFSRERNENIKRVTAKLEEEEDAWYKLQAQLEKLKKKIGQG
ncbi:MAG TPA: ATP-binding cassette domain-containing protein [Verrucomicrobiae bacterium]|jgi:ATP-binding cassette subfamily F protein 3|nr:ATP-binding cassette domain-containing protein [Verrucomicrobiae bacterium]